jgi:hypothetical protein
MKQQKKELAPYANRAATRAAKDKPAPALSEDAAPVWIAGAEVRAGGGGGGGVGLLETDLVLV